MTQAERMAFLIRALLREMPAYREEAERLLTTEKGQRRLLRSLMNIRPPMPLDAEFRRVEGMFLDEETKNKGIVTPDEIKSQGGRTGDGDLLIWQGDITRLAVDAIVNAANSALLGCFVPCHGCIDNAIHSAAGLELRAACNELMERQGHPEPPGRAKITSAFHLPSRYVIHTVGPIIENGIPTREQRAQLAGCYRSSLDAAKEQGLQSIAFCCISTGEFRFPNRQAAEIACHVVREWKRQNDYPLTVIFNVFKAMDAEIYRTILNPSASPGEE